MVIVFLALMLLKSSEAASQLRLRPMADSSGKNFTFKLLPQKFYTRETGWFCKKEVQLQKAIRLPLFVRLGSKDEVDRIEGKKKH